MELVYVLPKVAWVSDSEVDCLCHELFPTLVMVMVMV